MKAQNLKKILEEWNGKQVEYLKTIYQERVNEELFFEELIELCTNEADLQKGTTWLIKYHYDQKKALPESLVNPFIRAALKSENWEAQLHFLQTLPYLIPEKKGLFSLDFFVRKCLKSEVKFVRAWAYQGFYELTKYIPEYKQECLLLCEEAMEKESASIKARVRKVLKLLENS